MPVRFSSAIFMRFSGSGEPFRLDSVLACIGIRKPLSPLFPLQLPLAVFSLLKQGEVEQLVPEPPGIGHKITRGTRILAVRVSAQCEQETAF